MTDPKREFLFPVGSLIATKDIKPSGWTPGEPDYARVESNTVRADLPFNTYRLAPCGADGVVSWNPFRQECSVDVIHEQCEVVKPKPVDPRDYLPVTAPPLPPAADYFDEALTWMTRLMAAVGLAAVIYGVIFNGWFH